MPTYLHEGTQGPHGHGPHPQSGEQDQAKADDSTQQGPAHHGPTGPQDGVRGRLGVGLTEVLQGGNEAQLVVEPGPHQDTAPHPKDDCCVPPAH